MNTKILSNQSTVLEEQENTSPFIEANTVEMELDEIKRNHIIPVYIKDNEHLISIPEFVDLAVGVTHHLFEGEEIQEPSLRLSHPIKGRVPEAKGKPAKELLEEESTIYYERMAFVIRIPSITKEINGNTLALTVGGIKSYAEDNLNRKKGAPEHFTIFIGYLNKVCTNLCVWNEGSTASIAVTSSRELETKIFEMVTDFSSSDSISQFERLANTELREEQFAQLIGRAKLYQYLPKALKADIPQLLFNDTQISMIAKEYYQDPNFGRIAGGTINMWDLYNLFTQTNKSSYINDFVKRAVNATEFTNQLATALQEEKENWFLN